MTANRKNPPPDWQDPIVYELHAIRGKLVEEYQGDLHAYSKAARAHALALGFRFNPVNTPPTTPRQLE
jgi:hypothetical protein